MNIAKILIPLLLTLLTLLQKEVLGCSMYKLTVGNKTMVGCNEDAWRTTPRIWFENANNKNEYGAGFTGSRKVNVTQFAPQSGINEAGLTFSRLASYFPKQATPFQDRIKITNEVEYLTDILHKCATVDDVKNYIEQYDHSFFIDDVFMYIDSTGKYLVVEPYNLIQGNDPYYVLSNFCPSITDREKARKLERYRNGEDFLSSLEVDTSLSFCSALSDTMHVCRSRNGDGTLLTSIWDTKNRLVNLFFYHSYESTVQFNLADELNKGNHILNVASLFPVNPEFERLSNYVTPFNTPSLRVLLAVLGGVLTFLSFVFGMVFIRKRKTEGSYPILMVFSGLNLLTTAYFFVLATNMSIYYFDAPYKHNISNFISTSSYTPFILLLFIIPIMFYTFRIARSSRRKSWILSLLIVNNLIYILSILGFGYWGLYNVFS
jgi:hypothetical protein